jgi:hypothetical protein
LSYGVSKSSFAQPPSAQLGNLRQSTLRGVASSQQEQEDLLRRLHPEAQAGVNAVASNAAAPATTGGAEGLAVCCRLAGGLLALRVTSGSLKSRRREPRAVALRQAAEPQVDIVAEARAAAEAAKLELEAARLRKEIQQMERASLEERRTSRAKRLCDGASRLTVLGLKTRLMEEDKLAISEEQAKQLVAKVLGPALFEAAGDAAGLSVEQLASPAFDEELENVQQAIRVERLQQEAADRELAKQKAEQEAEKQFQQTLEAMQEEENTDLSVQTRAAAIFTYVLPLIDNAQFALALAQVFPPTAPIVLAIALPAQAINAIPFGTLIMFFIWATLVNNRELPRLVRFNLQQSVLLDIATFLPGILLSFGSFLNGGSGGMNPEASAGIFGILLLVVGYCVVMTCFGQEAELPAISGATRRAIDQQPGRL